MENIKSIVPTIMKHRPENLDNDDSVHCRTIKKRDKMINIEPKDPIIHAMRCTTKKTLVSNASLVEKKKASLAS